MLLFALYVKMTMWSACTCNSASFLFSYLFLGGLPYERDGNACPQLLKLFFLPLNDSPCGASMTSFPTPPPSIFVRLFQHFTHMHLFTDKDKHVSPGKMHTDIGQAQSWLTILESAHSPLGHHFHSANEKPKWTGNLEKINWLIGITICVQQIVIQCESLCVQLFLVPLRAFLAVYLLLSHSAERKFDLCAILFPQEDITSAMNGVGVRFTVKGPVNRTCPQLQ